MKHKHFIRESELFYEKLGYQLDINNPKSFNEKIVYKKLFDRNPLLILTADKYRVRDYIRSKMGEESGKYFVPIIWVGNNIEDIPFEDLPSNYIIKPNNASGRYIISKDNNFFVNRHNKNIPNLDRETLLEICKGWFKTLYGYRRGEWVYSKIEPLLIIEELLIDDDGDIPNDFRFYMFDGKCRFISITSDRLSQRRFTYYRPNWEKLDINLYGFETDNIDRPRKLDLMLKFSKKLSENFDFVRIDFFICKDKIYFGEITHYPASGLVRFVPSEFDFEVGKYWKLK
jgi:hypothetical protein